MFVNNKMFSFITQTSCLENEIKCMMKRGNGYFGTHTLFMGMHACTLNILNKHCINQEKMRKTHWILLVSDMLYMPGIVKSCCL